MSIRVLLADDHQVVRDGLKCVLAQEKDIEVVAEARTGAEAVDMAKRHRPGVVVMDIRMPKMDGLTALGRIKIEQPNMPILMFSGFDNPTYVARAVALGASGYLLKSLANGEIATAVRRCAGGDYLWTRDELRKVTGALSTPRINADVEVPLTHRESEVLRQLAHGLTNKEIARALKISYETVKEHVQHILRKVGVADRTQAAVWAVRKGLV
jgi:DNA-binding NarL/FixJ family response regulator